MLVEDCYRVDVRQVMKIVRASRLSSAVVASTTRFGFSAEIRCSLDLDAGELVLNHTVGGRWAEDVVPLDVTEPEFGGIRFWGRCPSCDRRLAILYAAGWTPAFRCRSCVGVKYATAMGTRADRALARIGRLHAKLGGPGPLGFLPRRPKHMKRHTYLRLLDDLRAAWRAHDQAAFSHPGKTTPSPRAARGGRR